jgi:NADH pyrophosphatase NudC (nudix superfamily)
MSMSSKRDELKTKLLAQAEATIDRLLSDERLNEQMTLSDIEAVVGRSEADFRQRALAELIAMQQDSPGTCPVCGEALRNKGKRTKRVVTLRGETDVERSYYQCERCRTGYFPPR